MDQSVEFSKKYKYVKRDRILPKVSEPSVSSASVGSAAEAAVGTAVKAGDGAKPLNRMQFVIIGKTSKKKADLGKAVAELGGKLVTAVDDKVAACISTKGALVISVM